MSMNCCEAVIVISDIKYDLHLVIVFQYNDFNLYYTRAPANGVAIFICILEFELRLYIVSIGLIQHSHV